MSEEQMQKFKEYRARLGCCKTEPVDSNENVETLCRWCFAYFLRTGDVPCDLSPMIGAGTDDESTEPEKA
jgi:hypothetical protein